MTPDHVTAVVREGLWMAGLIGGPLLLSGLLIGVFVGVLQAATQVQEGSLTFIPKVVALMLTLAAMGPWAIDKMTAYTALQIESIGTLTSEER
jgi:flagellar biosynthesis protein FliQ